MGETRIPSPSKCYSRFMFTIPVAGVVSLLFYSSCCRIVTSLHNGRRLLVVNLHDQRARCDVGKDEITGLLRYMHAYKRLTSVIT